LIKHTVVGERGEAREKKGRDTTDVEGEIRLKAKGKRRAKRTAYLGCCISQGGKHNMTRRRGKKATRKRVAEKT